LDRVRRQRERHHYLQRRLGNRQLRRHDGAQLLLLALLARAGIGPDKLELVKPPDRSASGERIVDALVKQPNSVAVESLLSHFQLGRQKKFRW